MSNDSNVNVKMEGMGNEFAKAIHGAKSYIGKAFLTFFLYYVGFYFIGLIVNLLFLSQANESKRIVGRSPSGRGCLIFLLLSHLLIPIIVVILLVTVGLGGIMAFFG